MDHTSEDLDAFRARVYLRGRELYRDLPWRRTRDAYAIWVSEAMLQQTQVSRVDGRWQRWLERFPSVAALAAASSADVLDEWQGLGYNRRALALWRAAGQIVSEHGGRMPIEERDLRALPGIGPATAAGVRAFAYDLPGVYLETNVRTVFLHHCFPDAAGVPDRELTPLVEAACPAAPGVSEPGPYAEPEDAADTPRSWYYALLDYGAELKRTIPNPSRRSSSYSRQSKFEGSRRQKRAEVVRMLLAAGESGLALEEVTRGLSAFEVRAGRGVVNGELAQSILSDLVREGFCLYDGQKDSWRIA